MYITFDFVPPKELGLTPKRTASAWKVLAPRILHEARFGPDGIREQFARSAGEHLGELFPWPPTHGFGDYPIPARTMVQKGTYRDAWLGKSGGVQRIGAADIVFGPDSTRFPFLHIHQTKKLHRFKVTKRVRGAVRTKWDVNLKPTRKVLVLRSRPVGVSRRVMERIGEMVLQYVTTGKVR